MIKVAELLCIPFVEEDTNIKIYREKKLIYSGKYIGLQAFLLKETVIGFSFVTYKSLLKIAIL